MHTLIVGSHKMDRRAFLKRLLAAANVELPIYGYRTTMLEPDIEGTAEIHIHSAFGAFSFSKENLVGLCKDRKATAFPEVFESHAFLIENVPQDVIILLDEIGPMEEDAPRFKTAVLRLLDGDAPVLAAVRDNDTAYLRAVRSHPKVRCFVMGIDDEKLFAEALAFFTTQFHGR